MRFHWLGNKTCKKVTQRCKLLQVQHNYQEITAVRLYLKQYHAYLERTKISNFL